MTPQVAQALAELSRAFPEIAMHHQEDGQGGAYVITESLPLGPAFVPSASWVGFAIPSLYPRADVYPHFVRADLARADGVALSAPLNPGHTMPGFGLPAVMVSRRSNRWNPNRDTAALKLHRVLLWFWQQGKFQEIAA